MADLLKVRLTRSHHLLIKLTRRFCSQPTRVGAAAPNGLLTFATTCDDITSVKPSQHMHFAIAPHEMQGGRLKNTANTENSAEILNRLIRIIIIISRSSSSSSRSRSSGSKRHLSRHSLLSRHPTQEPNASASSRSSYLQQRCLQQPLSRAASILLLYFQHLWKLPVSAQRRPSASRWCGSLAHRCRCVQVVQCAEYGSD